MYRYSVATRQNMNNCCSLRACVFLYSRTLVAIVIIMTLYRVALVQGS